MSGEFAAFAPAVRGGFVSGSSSGFSKRRPHLYIGPAVVYLHVDEHGHGDMGKNWPTGLFSPSARSLAGLAGFSFIAAFRSLALAMGAHIPDIYADHALSTQVASTASKDLHPVAPTFGFSSILITPFVNQSM